MRIKRALALALLPLMLIMSACVSKHDALLSKNNPVAIVIWHYYNGAQKQAFDELVQKFNETVGSVRGIVVEAYSQGGVEDLKQKVIDAADKKVGAENLPDIFGAYSDTAFEIKRRGLLADVTQYLSSEELGEYVPAYLYEGESEAGKVLMFPVAKSTEILAVNHTAWTEFAAVTGADAADLETWEGITKLAQMYYEYTDLLTPEPDDGQAFFGRDSMGNYMLVGAYQLGAEMFVVEDGVGAIEVDRDAMRRLWDNHYVPYIKGHFAAVGRFRSDDIKTGDIIALTGSTSGSMYLPSEVTDWSGATHPIEMKIYPLPGFKGTQPAAVQQGAGLTITKSTEQREYAASIFLKWFTDSEQNLVFSLNSGYMPVKTAAGDMEKINEVMAGFETPVPQVVRDTLEVGIGMTKSYRLYATEAFQNGIPAREIVTASMQDWANADLEAVNALVAGGMSRAQAVAEFDTDENFDRWLDSLNEALDALG